MTRGLLANRRYIAEIELNKGLDDVPGFEHNLSKTKKPQAIESQDWFDMKDAERLPHPW